MPLNPQRPLHPTQRATAAELAWYRAWLRSTGRELEAREAAEPSAGPDGGPPRPALAAAPAPVGRCPTHGRHLVELVPGTGYCPTCHQATMTARGLGNDPNQQKENRP
jgi:hypothetical protein